MTGDEHRAAAEEALREAQMHAKCGRGQSAFAWIEIARTHVLLAEWDAAHRVERDYADGSPE